MQMENYERCISVSESNPAIVKDAQLCVECGHCLAVCQEEIGVAGRRMVPDVYKRQPTDRAAFLPRDQKGYAERTRIPLRQGISCAA